MTLVLHLADFTPVWTTGFIASPDAPTTSRS